MYSRESLIKKLSVMLYNYLLSAIRNLKKNLTFSLINIFGLGLGLTVTLLLTAWVIDELSFDQFHEKASSIYRLSMEYGMGGQTAKTSVSPTALLPTLRRNFEEVETGVRVYNPSGFNPYIVRHDEKLFQEGKFYFADSTFFEVFSYKLLQGNPERALREPASVVISQSMSKKYFGEEPALGKTIQVNNSRDYTITGIVEDAPSNSYLQYDFIGSFSSLRQAKEEIWWTANYQTFAVLNPKANITLLADKTNAIVKDAVGSDLPGPSDYVRYNWTKLTDLHLRSETDGEMETVGSILYVYLFSAIALIVLLIAGINYVNLSTARATDRAKEVGVRKVAGAARAELIFQFIGESVVITLLSFAFAMVAAQLLLSGFNSLADKNLSHQLFFSPAFFSVAAIVVLLIGLLAGIYPALAITAFKPVSVLKGNFRSSNRGVLLRQSLVVFQFGVSVILIVGTLVILQQLNFVRETRLGYDRENVIALPLDVQTEKIYDPLRTEFLRSGVVQEVGRSTESPTAIMGGYSIKLDNPQSREIALRAVSIDENYLPTLNMELIAGSNLTEADMTRVERDTVYSFILNESALRELMIPLETAVGTRMVMNGRKGEIKGVVKDFHFASLHQKIAPLAMFNERDQFNYIFVKIKPGDVSEALKKLSQVCAHLISHRPFEYEFLDQQYAALYKAEQKTGVLSFLFAGLAIIIAGLGLLGLVTFATAQRMKEIGIRKVLGASVLSIMFLITKDFSKLVLIAIFLGLPLAWWMVNQWWLSNFAYKTEIGISSFLIATLACLSIAFGAAGFQALRAAGINPTNTLRNE